MDTIDNILLYTENISKNFQGIKAVNNVNFKINKNEIRALIGPNGAGKTTFVSLLCGRIKASKGKVVFGGKDISDFPVYKRISNGIGYTFQITSIFFNWRKFSCTVRSVINKSELVVCVDMAFIEFCSAISLLARYESRNLICLIASLITPAASLAALSDEISMPAMIVCGSALRLMEILSICNIAPDTASILSTFKVKSCKGVVPPRFAPERVMVSPGSYPEPSEVIE